MPKESTGPATVKIADVTAGFNPRGEIKQKDIEELAESVRQMGVLQPIIARVVGKEYQVIAGHRRLAAAKLAGLKEIPCTVVEATDGEAAEIAIVENLQRADVHPLDEAAAYLKLVRSLADVKAVAARVGKPVKYVERRIKLLRLGDAAAKAYRAGELRDDMAEEIATLETPADQAKAMKSATGYGATVKSLRNFISRELLTFLKRQPWVGDAEALKAVGQCTKCPKLRDTLFGAATADECVSVECWKVKMKKYLEHLKSKHEGAVLIADEGYDSFGAMASWTYDKVGKKPCKHAVPGVDVNTLKVSKVCFSKDCMQHRGKSYDKPVTPEEKAKKKLAEEKKAAENKKKQENEDLAHLAKIDAIEFPPKRCAIDALAESIIGGWNCDTDALLRRRSVTVKDDEDSNDAFRRLMKPMDDADAFRLTMELACDQGNEAEELADMATGKTKKSKS